MDNGAGKLANAGVTWVKVMDQEKWVRASDISEVWSEPDGYGGRRTFIRKADRTVFHVEAS